MTCTTKKHHKGFIRKIFAELDVKCSSRERCRMPRLYRVSQKSKAVISIEGTFFETHGTGCYTCRLWGSYIITTMKNALWLVNISAGSWKVHHKAKIQQKRENRKEHFFDLKKIHYNSLTGIRLPHYSKPKILKSNEDNWVSASLT